MPQFDVSTYTSQIFWLILSFLILYGFFSCYLLPRLDSVWKKRLDATEGLLQKGQDLTNQAKTLQEKLDAQRFATRLKVSQNIQQAQWSAKKNYHLCSQKKTIALQELMLKTEKELLDEKQGVLECIKIGPLRDIILQKIGCPKNE